MTDLPDDVFANATRASLLSRLRAWDDGPAWRKFFELYWRLIYDFARRCGLDDALAQDAVQETMVSVAEAMPGFKYDRSRGSFKNWLLQITKRRVVDLQRRKGARVRNAEVPLADESMVGAADDSPLEAAWEAEWQSHLEHRALEMVRSEVTPAQLQMFQLSVLRGWKPGEVAKALGVTTMQVYLARHRVGKLMRQAALTVRAEEA